MYTEDDVIQDFLWVDSCAKVADKVSIDWEYQYTWRDVLPLHIPGLGSNTLSIVLLSCINLVCF